MQPDDLCPVEDVELSEVVRSAVDLSDVTDVRTFVVQRARQTDVEIRGQNGTNKTAENEFGELAITGADLAFGRAMRSSSTLCRYAWGVSRCFTARGNSRTAWRGLG